MCTKLCFALFACLGVGFAHHVSHAAPDALSGNYLEVRSAAVFAGACHVNSEADSQGRQALLAIGLESGTYDGEDLAGVRLAVAMSADENLLHDGARRSVVYLDDGPSAAAREAAVSWLRFRYGDRLGEIREVVVAPLTFAVEQTHFRLELPGVLDVQGDVLADRACCSMPENIWYEPLLAVDEALVGNATRCRFTGAEGLPSWTYEDQNNAYLGRLQATTPCGVAESSSCLSALLGRSPE